MRIQHLNVQGKKILAVVLAGSMFFVTGLQHRNPDSNEFNPAILPEKPSYEVVLEKKRKRKNGTWV